MTDIKLNLILITVRAKIEQHSNIRMIAVYTFYVRMYKSIYMHYIKWYTSCIAKLEVIRTLCHCMFGNM